MAPGVAPEAQVGATPDAIPATTPVAAHRVACGGACAAACGVPQCRAHRAAHVPAPGAALGGGGPTMAPSVDLGGGGPAMALGAAPVGGPGAPPLRIDTDSLFSFLERRLLD